jgi:hypothetical protein
MFAEWPSWLSRSPSIRRRVIKLWRVLLRMQRACLANAVLVLRRRDGRVLVLPSPSGGLRLPVKQLDAWIPIAAQVEEWLGELLQEKSKPSLVAIDGTPAEEVTFIYVATADASQSAKTDDQLWLDTDVAASSLRDEDGRLLRLCTSRAA